MKSILISSAVLVSLFSASAWADISGTTSISSGQSFSLDTGAVSNAGDFTFTGSSLTLQGGATGAAFPGGGGAATYGFLTQALVQQVAALFSSAPIPTAVDAVIAFKTRGGNFAKM